MESSEIGREYHQAEVIYVCSGCEADMLDVGNGADLYLNTAPHCHYHFPTCRFPVLKHALYSILGSNSLSPYSIKCLCFLLALVYEPFQFHVEFTTQNHSKH